MTRADYFGLALAAVFLVAFVYLALFGDRVR